VYAATLDGRVLCVDAGTGDVLWTYVTDADGDGPNAFRPGFQSSPCVDAESGSLFVGDEDGYLHVIDLKTGDRRWLFETLGEIISSPTVVTRDGGHTVLFGSYDNVLYALDAAGGEELWQAETLGYVHCTPAVATDPDAPSGRVTFIAGCDETLRVLDVGTGEERLAVPLGTYLISSPAVFKNFLYLGTYQGETLAVDWKSGEITWRSKPEGGKSLPMHSSAAVTDDVVIIGGRDKLVRCHDRRTGDIRWTAETRGRVDSSPVVAGDRVYVGSSDRKLYTLDLATGDVFEATDVGRPVTASPAVADGLLVIGTSGSNGKVIAFGK
ncbi:MAG: PQQ-binding-like beta-propeller repeat protein, partial [Planctomycetota bacterium]